MTDAQQLAGALLFGILIGIWLGCWQLKGYQRWVIAEKAKDGTAEYIDNKCYYIITDLDWRLLEAWRIPQLRRDDDTRQVEEQEDL